MWKWAIFVFCLLVVTVSKGKAQIQLSNTSAVTIDFNNLNTNFGGAYNSVGGSSLFPSNNLTGSSTIYSGAPNPAVMTDFTDYSPGGVYSNTDTYSTSFSMRALRDGSTNDYALGLRDNANHTITLRVQNTSGNAFSSLNMKYDVEQYSRGTNATKIRFSYSLNGTDFISTNLTGGADVTADTSAASPANLATIISTTRVATIAEVVANNNEVYFRWSYEIASGSTPHLGLDNIIFSGVQTPVPEPTTILGLSAVALAGGCVRRRVRRG